jgi:hypothetical protein
MGGRKMGEALMDAVVGARFGGDGMGFLIDVFYRQGTTATTS